MYPQRPAMEHCFEQLRVKGLSQGHSSRKLEVVRLEKNYKITAFDIEIKTNWLKCVAKPKPACTLNNLLNCKTLFVTIKINEI